MYPTVKGPWLSPDLPESRGGMNDDGFFSGWGGNTVHTTNLVFRMAQVGQVAGQVGQEYLW